MTLASPVPSAQRLVRVPQTPSSAEAPDWAVHAGWRPVVQPFWASAQGEALGAFLRDRLNAGATVYPPQPLRALALTAPDAVRVVVLGQDPYHGPGQAEGLAFSVPPCIKPPPSLRNIFKERSRDLGLPPRADGSLLAWARQGVLLLNTCLTVEDGKPASHAGHGWEALTDDVIRWCGQSATPTAFLLWGAHAQRKAELIAADRHLVLRANHPSPLSANRGASPFIGCGHFGQVNRWLQRLGKDAICW